jgi:hypothetical protein
VPIYGYDCARCGAVDLVRPMTQAGEPTPVPKMRRARLTDLGCPGAAVGRPRAHACHGRERRSADAPAVVDRIPRGPRTRIAIDPRHLRLPRP